MVMLVLSSINSLQALFGRRVVLEEEGVEAVALEEAQAAFRLWRCSEAEKRYLDCKVSLATLTGCLPRNFLHKFKYYYEFFGGLGVWVIPERSKELTLHLLVVSR